MAEILEKAEVARIRALVLYEGSGERWDAEELADSHELLRARLESAEAAIREGRNQCVYAKWENRDALRLHLERAYAALGAAGERSEG